MLVWNDAWNVTSGQCFRNGKEGVGLFRKSFCVPKGEVMFPHSSESCFTDAVLKRRPLSQHLPADQLKVGVHSPS